ncbi:Lovastatin diketide synthase LovF [Cytospora mali]|uniref:Lovastatin diketide synthase LovF n=1 Tax=Cytospora mali TaxID=578113 RepID=A0A194W4F0_CYTMA|nr:Lovastatin diketide synthase LovF [Valsa mali]
MGSNMESTPHDWVNEPIAIVGLSCKFAGDASSPEKLWKMLAEGRSAWSEFPSSRFNAKGAYHPNHEKLSTASAHFLDEDLALFDAAFFNFSAELTSALDPQFRLQLESVYEALENAGLPLEQVAGSNTSVFAGTFVHDYRDALVRDEDNLPRFFLAGVGAAMASNRISHFFDFRGASMTIDTGCSTALVALHQAVQNLRSGESDMSIVGGSNIIFNPDNFKAMGSLGFLSPDGKCFAFDSRANGYGRGEGVATLVIKRLRDAIAAGDPVRAVIRETALNQDGKTETITSPSQAAQEALMRECYSRAGLDPASTQYFEAHGTGTATGDVIEANAIASTFQGRRGQNVEALRLGSVKTNVGHTEATSGLASLIKVILAMEKGLIPPSINFEKPNPKLALNEWNLKVATDLEPWPASADGFRRASVNNFGYGGSNAHVILEDGQSWVKALKSNTSIANGVSKNTANGAINGTNGITNGTNGVVSRIDGYQASSSHAIRWLILTCSGKDEQACRNTVSKLKEYLAQQDEHEPDKEDAETFLQSLAYTLGQRRTRLPWVSLHPVPFNQGINEVITALETPKFRPSRTPSRQPRIGMVFTGQGAQWHAMGRELIAAYPVFKESLQEGDAILTQLGADWSLMEELQRDAETTRVNGTGFSIPICVAVQISLVRLLRTWGVTPAAVTSHSSGEIAAAYTVGAVSYRLAMGIAYYRSRLAAEMTADGPIKGGMIAVGLGRKDSEEYLGKLTCGAKAVIACVNSPSSTTVAGDLAAVLELEALLQTDGVFARRLRVDTAYHSHHMNPIADDYRKALRGMTAGINQKAKKSLDSVAFASPVTGYRMTSADKIADPEHWVRSLVRPVQFVDAFSEMVLGDLDVDSDASVTSVDLIVEVGPHTALGGPIQEILMLPEFEGIKLPYYGSLVRKANAVESLQALAANLIREGYPLDLEAVNFPHGRSKQVKVLTNLPSYPWNHQTRHWLEPRVNKGLRNRTQPPHNLLGSLVPGSNPDMPTWKHILRAIESPWVRDHSIQNNMLYPGCGFVSLAIEGLRQQMAILQEQGEGTSVDDISGYQVRDVNVLQALVIPDTEDGIEIQTVLRPVSDKAIGVRGWKQFEVFSVTADNQWTQHAQGLISAEVGTPSEHTGVGLQRKQKDRTPLDPTSGYAKRIDPEDMWNVLGSMGIQYGPTFRDIKSIVQSGREMRSVSTIVIPDTSVAKDLPPNHVVHPATLDAFAQGTFTALPGTESYQESSRVFQSIDKLWVSSKIAHEAGHSFQCHTYLNHADGQGIESEIFVVDEDSDGSVPVLEIKGLVLSSLGRSATNDTKPWEKDLCSKIEWVSAPESGLDSQAAFEFSTKSQRHQELGENEVSAITDLRRVSLYFIRDALTELSQSQVDALEGYRARLHKWMLDELQKAPAEWRQETSTEQQALIDVVSKASINGRMVAHLGPHLAAVLRGEKDPLELMKEDDLLEEYQNPTEPSPAILRSISQAAAILSQVTHANPRMRILEIGASTGASTAAMLEALGTAETGGPLAELYHFTNASGDFEDAREKFVRWDDIVSFEKLDINSDVSVQGFEAGSYDLVIASQATLDTQSIPKVLANIHSLLKPGGKVLLVEITRDELEKQLVYGLLQQWWEDVDSQEDSQPAEFGHYRPALSVVAWGQTLKDNGFSGVDFEISDCERQDLYTTSTILSTVPSITTTQLPASGDIVLVTSSTASSPPPAWLEALQRSLSWADSGPLPAVKVLETAPATAYTGKICVFLGEMDQPLLRDIDAPVLDALKAMATSCKGLLWVTRGGAVECSSPDLALASGFLRSLRNEYFGRPFLTLDLDPKVPVWAADDVTAIVKIVTAGFSSPTGASDTPESPDSSGPGEFEYAVRDGTVMVPRLFRDTPRNKAVSPNETADLPQAVTTAPLHQADRPLRMNVGMPGLLDTLAFVDDSSVAADTGSPLSPEIIEVEPRAYGVNFRDVMVAMGQLQERVMGLECSGIITRLGSEAESHGYKVGDRVFCLLRGPFGSRAQVEWTSVMQMPAGVSFEEAASLPVIFCTAYMGLIDLGRLERGQTVLIHAAAGGVGQAAIMVAKHLGAEIFATVGTPDKRQLVKDKYGIPDDHIFSSRDASFATGIIAATGGRGVDVVLNSLAGPLLQESFNVLAPFGHFVEIGKRDLEINSHLEMRPFARQVTFSAFYLLTLMQHKPHAVHRALAEIARHLEAKIIAPVHPVTAYPMGEVAKAFRLLQTGKHMGKVVLSAGPEEMVPTIRGAPTPRFSPDASYLLVGGVGGIGRSIAHWMVAHGAKNLILLSRSAGRSEKTAAFVDELREVGCRVKPVSCDVANQADLEKALHSCEKDGLPPVRGVIQAAMVLQDTVLEQMTLENFKAAIVPKVHGTWNLHQKFDKAGDLDFFVILSSAVGVAGNASQSNYAAAGSYEDALARWRVAHGLPCVSIDLGAVKAIGVAAETAGVLGRLGRIGFLPMSEEQVLAVLGSAIVEPHAPQVVVGLNTGPGKHWDSDGESQLGRDARFAALRAHDGRQKGNADAKPGGDSLASKLAASSSLEEAGELVGVAIAEKLSDIFMIPVDDIDMANKPAQYGIDSLVAVELRNMLLQKAAAEISIFGIMQNASLAALAADVAAKSAHVKFASAG